MSTRTDILDAANGPADERPITPERAILRHLYTEGWCPLLAWAFKAVAPGHFYVVETTGGLWHCAALDDDGMVWDICGVVTQDEFTAKWDGGIQPWKAVDDEHQADFERSDWFAVARAVAADHFPGGVPDLEVWTLTCALAQHLIEEHDQ